MVNMANALGAFTSGEVGEIEISARTVTSLERLSEMGAGVGLASLATDLNNVASVQGLSANINSLNSLDTDGVRSYNIAMEKLVETLEDLNKVLAEDNTGTFGGGTGVSAASMLESGQLSGGGSGNGNADLLTALNSKIDTLNDTMTAVKTNTRNTVGAISNNLQTGIA